MLERAWEISKKTGGVLLVAEIIIFVIGSAHSGHVLRNSREFGQAFDEVAGSVVSECRNAAHWITARGQ
jgi:hypothetical protein